MYIDTLFGNYSYKLEYFSSKWIYFDIKYLSDCRKLQKYSVLDSASTQKHLEKVALQVGLQQSAGGSALSGSTSAIAQLFRPESALAPLLLQHVHDSDKSTRFAILLNQFKLVFTFYWQWYYFSISTHCRGSQVNINNFWVKNKYKGGGSQVVTSHE